MAKYQAPINPLGIAGRPSSALTFSSPDDKSVVVVVVVAVGGGSGSTGGGANARNQLDRERHPAPAAPVWV